MIILMIMVLYTCLQNIHMTYDHVDDNADFDVHVNDNAHVLYIC